MGCNASKVIYLKMPVDWSSDNTTHTAVLKASEPQPLRIGGTRIEVVETECTSGTIPGNFRVCLKGSTACAQDADKPPTADVSILYNCISAPTPSQGH